MSDRAHLCVRGLAVAAIAVWTGASRVLADDPPPRKRPPSTQPQDQDASEVGRLPDVDRGPRSPFAPRDADELGRPRGHGRDRFTAPRRPFFDRLPEEERVRVAEFIAEHFPEAGEELQRLREARPNLAERMLDRLMPEMLRLMRSKETDPPKVFELKIQEHRNEYEVHKTMNRYRVTDDAERREKLRVRMRELLEEGFDLRQRRTALEIQELEARIADLRERLADQVIDRDRLIDEELELRLSSPDAGPPHRGRRHPPGRGPAPERRPAPRPDAQPSPPNDAERAPGPPPNPPPGEA